MKEELVELQSSPVLCECHSPHSLLFICTLHMYSYVRMLCFVLSVEALSQIKNIARLYSILHRELRVTKLPPLSFFIHYYPSFSY